MSEWHEGARDGSLSACETVLSDIVERYASYAILGQREKECRRFIERLVEEYDRKLHSSHTRALVP